MGANPHDLPAQAHAKEEKTMVVRKGGSMTKSKQQTRGIDWTAIFKRRPDLQPPGYYETIDKLYPKEDSDESKQPS